GARQPRTCLVVGGGGDLQDLAYRLDSELPPVLVDVVDHLARRPSSSAAKKADALFRISFARRSSRFSLSSSVIRRRSSEVTPGRLPSSISACLTQLRSDSGPIPSCLATRVTTPKRSPFSAMAPRTILTARSRSSGGYRRWLGLFDVDMESSYSQRMEPPINLGQFMMRHGLGHDGQILGLPITLRECVLWSCDGGGRGRGCS